MPSLTRRFGVLALLTLMLALPAAAVAASGAGTAARAQQSETYRFWSYWHVDGGSWTLAQKGSSSVQPADGSVEGWRFTKSSGDAQQSAKPRPEHAFAQICGTTPPREGSKRVAVVIDYGTPQDTSSGTQPPVPRSDCARVPTEASGTDALAEVASPQLDDSGMVCRVDGYPRGACGSAGGGGDGGAGESGASPGNNRDEQQDATPSEPAARAGGDDGRAAAQSGRDSGFPVAAVAGVVVAGLLIGGLGGAAVLRARKPR